MRSLSTESLLGGPICGIEILCTGTQSYIAGPAVIELYPKAAGARYERRADGRLWYIGRHQPSLNP